MLVEAGIIAWLFAEPGVRDNPQGIPVAISDTGTLLARLRARAASPTGAAGQA